jgi:hypothetical protein
MKSVSRKLACGCDADSSTCVGWGRGWSDLAASPLFVLCVYSFSAGPHQAEHFHVPIYGRWHNSHNLFFVASYLTVSFCTGSHGPENFHRFMRRKDRLIKRFLRLTHLPNEIIDPFLCCHIPIPVKLCPELYTFVAYADLPQYRSRRDRLREVSSSFCDGIVSHLGFPLYRRRSKRCSRRSSA